MFRIPVSSLPLKKQHLLAKSMTKPPMYITIEKHDYDKIARAVVYELQIGVQHGQDIVTTTIRKRFSEMDRLDKTIRAALCNHTNFPQFPPKKWIGNTNEAFIQQRTEDLDRYLIQLLRVPGIIENSDFKQFFDIQTQ